MFLITTAEQRFWNKKGKGVLFLGEWCKLYAARNVWSKMDYETLEYHWDDREKLYTDYRYLRDVYERYLGSVGACLNKIHGIKVSKRFWRIFIGSWLSYFLEIFYDRYLSILNAIDSGMVSDVWVLDSREYEKWVPEGFFEINHWLNEDSYNHFLYSWIIEKTGKMPYTVVEGKGYRPKQTASDTESGKKARAKYCLGKGCQYIPSFLNKVVFVYPYFSLSNRVKLQLCLRQFPYIEPYSDDGGVCSIDRELRSHILISGGENQFEKLLDAILPIQIPKLYLEGFKHLEKKALNEYPRTPQVIITAQLEGRFEKFRLWLAWRVESGVKLGMVQHGGHFGMGKWCSLEDNHFKLADRYYSWGWREGNSLKGKVLPASKLVGIDKRLRKQNLKGEVLWVLGTWPRYAYRMYSVPVAGQVLAYMSDQYQFAERVSKAVFKILKVSPRSEDYGWQQKERLRAWFPDLKIYESKESLIKRTKRSRLFIGTYNATTYLESMAANHPTLIFWNPKHWELREEAEPYFDLLESVGIFHKTPESAADKVNAIYKNPFGWWQQEKIQKAKKIFCNRFAKTSKKWLKEWKLELLDFK